MFSYLLPLLFCGVFASRRGRVLQLRQAPRGARPNSHFAPQNVASQVGGHILRVSPEAFATSSKSRRTVPDVYDVDGKPLEIFLSDRHKGPTLMLENEVFREVYNQEILPHIKIIGEAPFECNVLCTSFFSHYRHHPAYQANPDANVGLTKIVGMSCDLFQSHLRYKPNAEVRKALVETMFKLYEPRGALAMDYQLQMSLVEWGLGIDFARDDARNLPLAAIRRTWQARHASLLQRHVRTSKLDSQIATDIVRQSFYRLFAYLQIYQAVAKLPRRLRLEAHLLAEIFSIAAADCIKQMPSPSNHIDGMWDFLADVDLWRALLKRFQPIPPIAEMLFFTG